MSGRAFSVAIDGIAILEVTEFTEDLSAQREAKKIACLLEYHDTMNTRESIGAAIEALEPGMSEQKLWAPGHVDVKKWRAVADEVAH